jgi:hypothetical protein
MSVKFDTKRYVMRLSIRVMCSILSVTVTRENAQVQRGDKTRWQCVWLFTITADERGREITQKE